MVYDDDDDDDDGDDDGDDDDDDDDDDDGVVDNDDDDDDDDDDVSHVVSDVTRHDTTRYRSDAPMRCGVVRCGTVVWYIIPQMEPHMHRLAHVPRSRYPWQDPQYALVCLECKCYVHDGNRSVEPTHWRTSFARRVRFPPRTVRARTTFRARAMCMCTCMRMRMYCRCTYLLYVLIESHYIISCSIILYRVITVKSCHTILYYIMLYYTLSPREGLHVRLLPRLAAYRGLPSFWAH